MKAVLLGLVLTAMVACGAGVRYTSSWNTVLYRCERGVYTQVDYLPHAVELRMADGHIDRVPMQATVGYQRKRQQLTQAVQRARAKGFVIFTDGDPGAALRDADHAPPPSPSTTDVGSRHD